MKPIYQVVTVIVAIMLIATIVFFVFGGQKEEVPQENIQSTAPTEVVKNTTMEPTTVPTVPITSGCVIRGNIKECTSTQTFYLNSETETVVPMAEDEHPALMDPPVSSVVKQEIVQGNISFVLITNQPTPVKWYDAQGSISLEDLAFWFGRNNMAWEGANKEIMYQRIISYTKEYRQGVIVKSAVFEEMVYSQDGKYYLVKNFSIDESYKDKLLAYAVTFIDPNDGKKKTMIFFFDKEGGGIAAFGYGNSISMDLKRNFVISSDSDGGSSGSSGGDSNGGSTDSDDDNTGGPVGDVPS